MRQGAKRKGRARKGIAKLDYFACYFRQIPDAPEGKEKGKKVKAKERK